MKYTSKELATLLGLKIGDKIKLSNGLVADVIEDYQLDFKPWKLGPAILVDKDFEIVQPKKKTGDLICKDVDCYTCPLRALHCRGLMYSDTLYKILENHFAEMEIEDKEIYDILKSRLDKEVE